MQVAFLKTYEGDKDLFLDCIRLCFSRRSRSGQEKRRIKKVGGKPKVSVKILVPDDQPCCRIRLREFYGVPSLALNHP
jgi:hypothetical protein